MADDETTPEMDPNEPHPDREGLFFNVVRLQDGHLSLVAYHGLEALTFMNANDIADLITYLSAVKDELNKVNGELLTSEAD